MSVFKVLVLLTVNNAIFIFIIYFYDYIINFFLVTALIYSSVGFGGGSTYLALLLLWGIPYTIFPIIALACNIIVVSGNSFNYIRAEIKF